MNFNHDGYYEIRMKNMSLFICRVPMSTSDSKTKVFLVKNGKEELTNINKGQGQTIRYFDRELSGVIFPVPSSFG